MTAPIPSRPLGPILTRRAALGVVGGMALAGPAAYALPPAARPGSLLDEVHNRVEPYLELGHAHTGETYIGRFYGAAGYDVAELQKLDWFLRDWRQRVSVQIDPRLFWALAVIRAVTQRAGFSGKATVNSGYRTLKTNSSLEGTARNSLHMAGRAIDLTFEKVPPSQLVGCALALQIGGVGQYPGFTHIDSGNLRTWGG